MHFNNTFKTLLCKQNSISKSVYDYVTRFQRHWKQKEQRSSCTINSEPKVKLSSLKDSRSNRTQKQSLCLTFAYNNTWHVLYIGTHSSNHLHLFCGVRCSQSVSQNIPVYWCSFFQMFDKKKRGPEKKSQIDSWQQRKMQGAICLPELTEQTSMSLFFKSFGKYILSLNKVCFEVTVVISRFPKRCGSQSIPAALPSSSGLHGAPAASH